MAKLAVTLSKLKRYMEEQGGYDIELESPNQIIISFVPSFPEALEKGWQNSSPPKVIMHGTISRGIVTFHLVQTEQENVTTDKDPDLAEIAYSDWLQYIEDSY